jgi:hypothetical protein
MIWIRSLRGNGSLRVQGRRTKETRTRAIAESTEGCLPRTRLPRRSRRGLADRGRGTTLGDPRRGRPAGLDRNRPWPRARARTGHQSSRRRALHRHPHGTLPGGKGGADCRAGRRPLPGHHGFTVVGPNRFLGWGHPDLKEAREKHLPSLLGLIESTDSGESWQSTVTAREPHRPLMRQNCHAGGRASESGASDYVRSADFEGRTGGRTVSRVRGSSHG